MSELERELVDVLAGLPVSVRITQRERGGYAWQWLDRAGVADTFTGAVQAALTALVGAFLVGENVEHVTRLDDLLN